MFGQVVDSKHLAEGQKELGSEGTGLDAELEVADFAGEELEGEQEEVIVEKKQ